MAHSIIDGLGLLDDDQILGWGLEGVWEGGFGLFETGIVSDNSQALLARRHTWQRPVHRRGPRDLQIAR